MSIIFVINYVGVPKIHLSTILLPIDGVLFF